MPKMVSASDSDAQVVPTPPVREWSSDTEPSESEADKYRAPESAEGQGCARSSGDSWTHKKMYDCIKELHAKRANDDNANPVKLLPSFVAMFLQKDRVFHLHPCGYIESDVTPGRVKSGVQIIKICEECLRACAHGRMMGFNPDDCRSPEHWSLRKKFDALGAHQKGVYRKFLRQKMSIWKPPEVESCPRPHGPAETTETYNGGDAVSGAAIPSAKAAPKCKAGAAILAISSQI